MARGSRRLREAACPLCDGTRAEHLATKRGFEIVRCTACALVFVWPQPTPQELEALYSAGHYHAEVDEAERRRYAARRLREIEGLVPRRGRLLDVGCSKGFFLEAARDEGWDAVGVELNRNAVDEARARGLDVRHGGLGDQAFEEASFDVLTLFDLIEHTRDPRAIFAVCRALLRPQGILVVTTPDIGGLVPQATYWLLARTIGVWEHPTPPGHLIQFSRRTLAEILDRSGFVVVAERSEHIPVAYSVGKLENSAMDVLAGRHRAQPKSIGSNDVQREAAAPPAVRRPFRGLPRLVVRAVSWAVVGGLGGLARLLGWGDSRWVAARKGGEWASAG